MLTTMMLFGVLAAALCVLCWELRRRSTDRVFVDRRRSTRLDGPELLETRMTPAVHNWVGGALVGGVPKNDWLIAANWDDKSIPIAGDTVNFNANSLNDCVLPAGGGVIQVDTVLINPGYSFTLNLNGSTLLVTSLLNFSDAVGKIDGGGGPALGNLRVAAIFGNNAAFNSAVSNAGEVDAAANNTLAVAGAYTQSGGVTNIGTYPQGGGRLTVSGLFDEQGGALNLYGYSTLQVGNGLQVRSGAALSDYGYGAITGDVTNAGSITVGDGQNVGLTLSITGNFTQTAAGVLNLGISGPYYQNSLSVSGQASLGGTLNVSQLGGPPPQRGDSHSLIHYGSRVGQFATLNLPPISGAVWVPNYDDLDHAFILMAQ